MRKHTRGQKAREAKSEKRDPMCPIPLVHPWEGFLQRDPPALTFESKRVPARDLNVEESVVSHVPSAVCAGPYHEADYLPLRENERHDRAADEVRFRQRIR